MKREKRKSHGLVHFAWKAWERKQKRCVILMNSSFFFIYIYPAESKWHSWITALNSQISMQGD